METLKYKVIKTKKQYADYCNTLEGLLDAGAKTKALKEEVELLTLLIAEWDRNNNSFEELDPVALIKELMQAHGMNATGLTQVLGVSKGLVSDILNYKKGLSKEVIRDLSSYFKISQEALNRPYKLKVAANSHLKNASVMNTKKELEHA